MKRTMLIVSHALELGGAERSLIGFLEALDESKWEIDLFLLRQEGELMDAIPDKVHLLPQKAAYTVLAHPMKATLKEGHVLLTMARLYGKTAAVIYDHKHNYRDSDVNLEYSHKYTSPFMPRIQPQKEYDLAVSFLTPHYIVTKKVNAKKRSHGSIRTIPRCRLIFYPKQKCGRHMIISHLSQRQLQKNF